MSKTLPVLFALFSLTACTATETDASVQDFESALRTDDSATFQDLVDNVVAQAQLTDCPVVAVVIGTEQDEHLSLDIESFKGHPLGSIEADATMGAGYAILTGEMFGARGGSAMLLDGEGYDAGVEGGGVGEWWMEGTGPLGDQRVFGAWTALDDGGSLLIGGIARCTD